MLQECEMVVAAQFTGHNGANRDLALAILRDDCARLALERGITPHAYLHLWVTLPERINNCDCWRNVPARPAADCQNLHRVSPLSD